MADRHHDRGGDRADLRCGGASLRDRRLDQSVEMAGCAWRAGPARNSQRHLSLARRARRVVGAGTLHLHVHLDGEVRCGLWRADRHPCRRRPARQPGAAALAQAGDPVQPAVRGFLHRHDRHIRRIVRGRDVQDRPAIERSRSADVDRLPRAPAWLRPDVLPLSAGVLVLLLDRRVAAPQRGASRGHRGQRPGTASGAGESRGRRPGQDKPARADPDPGADLDPDDLPRRKGRHPRAAAGACAPSRSSRC